MKKGIFLFNLFFNFRTGQKETWFSVNPVSCESCCSFEADGSGLLGLKCKKEEKVEPILLTFEITIKS